MKNVITRSISIDADLLEYVTQLAGESHRTVTGQINFMLDEHRKNREQIEREREAIRAGRSQIDPMLLEQRR